MATEITVAEVKEIVSTTLPDAVINAFIEVVDKADDCLIGQGLSDETIQIMKIYGVGHMAEMSSIGNIKSQSAPSGASRSFKDATGLASTSYGSTLQTFPAYFCIESLIDNTNQLYLMAINPKRCRK